MLGKEMFYHRTRGSCTSAAIYQTTVLRALGIPTRMIIAIPVVDASDPIQRELVWTAIRHREVRSEIVSGIAPLSNSFAAHTLNEVFVGGRWRRLNYSRLGQNNLDRTTMGLLTHVHTFGDLSEADLALTWGKRYGKGEKDKVFQHRNPYRAIELSDRFGIHGKIQVERGSSVPTHLTISKVYWYHSEAADPWLKKTASRDRGDGDGYLIAHVDEWDANMGGNFYSLFIKRADRHIVLAAEGQPNVTGRVTGNFWASLPKGFRELEILISKEELEKMKPGIDYSVIPRNSISEYRWKLSEEITVRR
ncbi:MAG: hypothetical protein O6952_09815 [Planctomycetota bacterium]|nr:hypothetical protein [Planctomycetota bacterium]